ncbi:MAG TPA: tetratricopeptide repeat protein [Burkholderiaceae bacterium]|nr:tetratricopeptide repeat protein [Burkholderiaceae bacterium]
MTLSQATELDSEELLHLAVAASDRDQTDQAIGLLKRAIDVDPSNARAHYLLGAEHAQIGLFDRAAQEMRRALELDGELDAARFQLGLLLLTSRQVEPAESAWKHLDRLGTGHFYVLFKTGLLCLANDEFSESLRCLRDGITANQENAPLNADMQRIAQQVEAILAQPGAAASADAEDSSAAHLLINAYTGRRH